MHNRIALLDLNYTLVANSHHLRGLRWPERGDHEQYRGWLVDMLRAMPIDRVILITVRPDVEREFTLANIARRLDGWQPDESYFNPGRGGFPPDVKEKILQRHIFPKYGTDGDRYLAVESNVDTHKMYARHKINGIKVFPHTEGEPVVRKSKTPALFEMP